MKAIGNNIIILPKKVVTDKTKGGLLLIEKDKEDIRAVVEGDEIYYDKHAGHGIEFEGDKYTIIKLQDIVVVL